jgi:hypothetical protein
MAEVTRPPIELFRDPEARWIRAISRYDPGEHEHLAALPAMFAIDEGGQVRYRYLSRNAGDRPSTALLLLAAESISGIPSGSDRS